MSHQNINLCHLVNFFHLFHVPHVPHVLHVLHVPHVLPTYSMFSHPGWQDRTTFRALMCTNDRTYQPLHNSFDKTAAILMVLNSQKSFT